MPIGYLITVVILAWCTFFAVAPPRPRRSSRSNLSFWFGCLVNELPFVAFLWLVAASVLAWAQDDLEAAAAAIPIGIAALTCAGLAVIVQRSFGARPAVEQALRDGLGTEWQSFLDPAVVDLSMVDPSIAGGVRQPRSLPRIVRDLVTPISVRPRGVERLANISYGDGGRANLLDVYRPRSGASGDPVFVHFHGGAFRSGSKSRETRPLFHRLARHGWVCISANYRLTPPATFPDNLIDVKRVIAWAREHAPELGADPQTLFIAGSSAGAHLASIAALTPNAPELQPGFEQSDTSVTGVVALYGYYGAVESGHTVRTSPSQYTNAQAPPFFVAHGANDTLVLVEDARAFVAQLSAASCNPVVYAELPGAQHVFDLFRSIRFDSVVDGIESFAAWVRSRPSTPR